MLGVKFDDLHCEEDLGLILQTVSVPLPEAKTNTIEIPGADGILDVTSAFGTTRFKNRKITMVFTDKDPYAYRYENITTVANALHGKNVKIIFDEDPEYYYQGRLSVKDFVPNKSTRTVTIEADCEPYKYMLNEGNEPWRWNTFSFENGVIRDYADITISGNTDVNVVGGWKAVHPIITSTAAMTVSIDNDPTVVSFGVGVTKLYNITIPYGEHTLHFHGNGKVGIRIQVGTF